MSNSKKQVLKSLITAPGSTITMSYWLGGDYLERRNYSNAVVVAQKMEQFNSSEVLLAAIKEQIQSMKKSKLTLAKFENWLDTVAVEFGGELDIIDELDVELIKNVMLAPNAVAVPVRSTATKVAK